MKISNKLFGLMTGLMVLAICIVSIVSVAPLAAAKNDDAGNQGNGGAEMQDNSENNDNTGNHGPGGNNGNDNEGANPEEKGGGHKFTSVDECVTFYDNKTLNISEDMLTSACENAFKMKEIVGPKFGDNIPRVQRFLVQKQEIVENFLEKLEDKEADKLGKLDRARLDECLNSTGNCTEKLKSMKVIREKAKDILSKRILGKDKLLEAQNKFLKAKNQYEEAKDNQQNARNEFNELKSNLTDCEDSEQNCSAIESQLLEKGKEDMAALADQLIQHLEKIKSRVESADNINETEASEAIAKIDDMIAQLEDAKASVNAATTKEELKSAGEEIKTVWKEADKNAGAYAERVVQSYTRGVFVRSELLETKLETVLAKLENKSMDTTEMQGLLDNFSNFVNTARDKIEQADELFNQAKELRESGDNEGAKAKLEESKKLTREAHESLKEAHEVLMELVHKINQTGESFNPDAVNENEEIEMIEEQESD